MSAPPEPQPVVRYVEPVPEFYARMLALTRMTREGLTQLDALNDEEKARLDRELLRKVAIQAAEGEVNFPDLML